MKIEAAEFSLGKNYEVDDVVFASEIGASSTEVELTEATIPGDSPLGVPLTDFFKDSDVIVSVYLTRSSDAVAGFESYTKFEVDSSTNVFDAANSRGVGIGIVFRDSGGASVVGTFGRLVPYGNIPISNYRCIKFIVKRSEIPSNARSVQPVALCSNISSGSFTFKNVNIEYVNKYFYCIQENTADASNEPSGDDGSDYWTKDFLWRPSFGAKFNFTNYIKTKKLGDGYEKHAVNGVNSLKLNIDYTFPNLTTKKASAIVHFLQQGDRVDSSSFTADDEANPLSSALISYFDLELPFPYKSKKVVLERYSHKENYFNNHTIDASFLCDKESNLDNVASCAGVNGNLDSSTIFNLESSSISLTKGVEKIFTGTKTINTSEKSNVFLKNYAKGSIASTSPGSQEIRFTPNADYTIDAPTQEMEFILPFTNAYGLSRSSIFIDSVESISYYPYDKIRTFPFFADLNFSISKNSLSGQSAMQNEYALFYKKSLNSTAVTIRLSFSRRSDEEIKSLLFFLESHLGYIPFRFKTPKSYNNKGINEDFKKTINRTFYCPEWSHDYVYKNNHTIAASFIEYILPSKNS
jgi:phage-related protein